MRNGKRGRYTLEFKQEAVRLVESGQSIASVARSLEVVDARSGHEIYSHTGGGPGVDTGLRLDMNTDTVSIFFSNFSPPFPQAFMERASDLMTRQTQQPPR